MNKQFLMVRKTKNYDFGGKVKKMNVQKTRDPGKNSGKLE